MDPTKLQSVVSELATRPRHEKVRSLVRDLLVDGLGAKSVEIEFEEQLPVVRGRLDALWGYTVFEVKSDLRREQEEAETKLKDYIQEKQRQTNSRHIGVITDGAEFQAYELLDGALKLQQRHLTNAAKPRDLLEWLDSVVCVSPDLAPSPSLVKAILGKQSMSWLVSRNDLAALWSRLSATPECALKRQLWADHLAKVYGTSTVDQDELFFQHTYLSIVAKTIAVHVLGIALPEPEALMEGRAFEQSGIFGAVESDFFDWPLRDTEGASLIRRVANQTGRFRLREVQVDVLKGLYESLVDPETRHELGEYYTPDWLADRICQQAITQPLTQRVLDPSCGSGTFLFHAVRRFLEAASGELSARDAIHECTQNVLGFDIHPLAVQIARVTYLLAIGPDRLKERDSMSVPVYLGDALQWNTKSFMSDIEVVIRVPLEETDLRFPGAITADPGLLDEVIAAMVELSTKKASPSSLTTWLASKADFHPTDVAVLVDTYNHLVDLNERGKNHIWGFVARNLVRPLWLSQEKERPDVIIGNPPWLSYHYMSPDMQERFKSECVARKIWTGGKVASQQDLSAYFLARVTELYFKTGTRLAFVMPYAVLSRRAYEGFRDGFYGSSLLRPTANQFVSIRFAAVWAFPDVQPLFPVPSCVLFCEPAPPFEKENRRVEEIDEATGSLASRDASREEAIKSLRWCKRPWPYGDDEEAGSPYRQLFKNGATIFPRVLATVELVPTGMLGGNPVAPLVRSRRSRQEKVPWKQLPPIEANVEREYLRPLYLGESIAPYRLLQSVLSVIPWDKQRSKLLTSAQALELGKLDLANWMSRAEKLWDANKGSKTSLTFLEQLDYYGKLTVQFPVSSLRVLYGASGSLIAACLLEDPEAIVENKLYWFHAKSRDEAQYLCSVLNSATVTRLIERKQSRGQWGPRDIHKIAFSLAIPKYDPGEALHRRIAGLAQRAEVQAASVALPERIHFISARQRIRRALVASGLAGDIDAAVRELLGSSFDQTPEPETD